MTQVRISYREALRRALREALAADARVFLMGEDVGRYGGSYAVGKGLLEEFGPERVRDTPLSELAFVGMGIGAALAGMRPIVEVMTVNFSLLALDQIVNGAALLRHMSGGQVSVPLVIRMATGAGRQLAAQHSHSLVLRFIKTFTCMLFHGIMQVQRLLAEAGMARPVGRAPLALSAQQRSSQCSSPGATGISGLHSRRTRGDRHSSRVEAKKPALLSNRDGYLLELTGWTQGSQAS